MKNRENSRTNDVFKERCEAANCRPSTRQMSRFLMGTGIAYKVYKKQAHPLEPNMCGYYEKPLA